MNKKFKKFFAGCLVTSMVVTNMLFTTAFAAPISGANRYETAAKIAKAGWTSASVAVLATGEDFPDALSAAPLAAAKDAPILLTGSASLDAYAKDALTTLGVDKVYVVGGEKAVSAAVLSALEALDIDVVRIAGTDRYETSVKVAAEVGTSSSVVLANGYSFADALSVSSIAAAKGMPILLTAKDAVSEGVKTFIGTKDVYVVGGSAVVAPAAVSGLNVEETLAGDNRYATNKEVLEYFADDVDFANVFLATGLDYPDALAGSAYAAKLEAPVVLVGSTLDAGVKNFLAEKAATDTSVIALGGASSVANAAKALENAINPSVDELTVESVTVINAKQIQVEFSKAIDEDTIIDSTDDTLLNTVVEITRIPATSDDRDVVANAAFASLNDDGNVLTITAAGATYFDGTYGIAIDDTVRDEDGDYMDAYSGNFTAAKDKVAPSVKDVTYNAATNEITVKMSEPVSVDPTVTVDGTPVTTTANDINDEFVVTNDATAGSTVKVVVAGAIDFNDNSQTEYSKSVKIDYVESDIKVTSVKQSSSNKIEVVFDRSMARSGDEATVAAGMQANVTVLRSGSAQAFTAAFDTDDTTNRTVIFTFDAGNGPDYAIYPTDKDSVTLSVVFGEEVLTDIYGNTNEEITKSVTMTKDEAGPVVSSVRLSADKKAIEVRFNEDVTEVSAGTLASLTVRDNGVIVSAAAGTEGFRPADAAISGTDARLVTIPYEDNTNADVEVPNGEYTVRFDKDLLKDNHKNNNAAIVTTVLKVTSSDAAGDTTVLLIEDKNTAATDITANNTYRVTFSDKVDASALSYSAYTLNGTSLPSTTDIVFEGSAKTSVMITIPSSTLNYDSATAPLRVVNVKDDNGNKVVSSSTNVEVVDNVKPVLSAATLSGNTLTLTFSENMDQTITATGLNTLLADLEIKGNSIFLQDLDNGTADVITSVDGKNVTITFTNRLAADNNWEVVKAASKITVKVVDDTLFADANDTLVKTDVTVTVVKK